MTSIKRFRALGAGLVALSLAAGVALAAEDFPSRPVRLIVPYPAGGSTDALARTFAQALTSELKQNVVVDNRPGAGGNIAMDLLAKAEPDGYTIGFGTAGPLAINVTLFSKLPYDPLRDFQPITLFGSTPNVVATSPTSGVKTMRALIVRAKAAPGTVSYGTGGNGTTQHLGAEMFRAAAGIKITHVPWNGGAGAITATIGNEIPVLFTGFTDAIGLVKSGKLVALAVTSEKRSPLLPDVPTIGEATGLSGIESAPWFGIVGPANLPAPILQKLNAASVAAIGSQAVGEKAASVAGTLTPGTPEQFAAFMRAEVPRWAKVVKEAAAKVD